jgi:hypothetical protein
MFAPLAAVLLAVGAYSTPPMIMAEQDYMKQHPNIQVEDIQAANIKVNTPKLGTLGS